MRVGRGPSPPGGGCEAQSGGVVAKAARVIPHSGRSSGAAEMPARAKPAPSWIVAPRPPYRGAA